MQNLMDNISSTLKKIDKGDLSKKDLDSSIQAIRELEERLVILRYKIYESQANDKVIPVEAQEPLELPKKEEMFELNFGSEEEEQVSKNSESTLKEEETKEFSSESLNEQEKQIWRVVRIVQNNRHPISVESLPKLFMLNEKLMFINELFEGSSEAFANAVKNLDLAGSIVEATKMIAVQCNQFHWDMESEVFEDFIYKICCRYA